jgi:hypothetical protein
MPMVFAPWLVNLDIRKNQYTQELYDGEGNFIGGNRLDKMSGWGNDYVHDVNIRRFGFTGGPTPLFERNLDFNSSEAIAIDNYPFRLSDPNYKQNSLDLRELADPRLTVCAVQPWVDTGVDEQGRPTHFGRHAPNCGIEHRDKLSWMHKKFINLKGVETGSPTGFGTSYTSESNIPVIRLADIYLLYAEVMHNLGQDGVALEYVNKVHRRAHGKDPNDTSFGYSSLTDQTKTVAPDDELANDVIKYERWAELFGEGQWWWDVRRWQIGKEEAQTYKKVRLGDVIFRGNSYYVQPIPQQEMDRNKGMVQSEGY